MRYLICLLWLWAGICAFAQTGFTPSKEPPITELGAIVSRICYPAFTNFKPVPETEFLTTDDRACLFLRYGGGNEGDKVRIEWVNPLGTVIHSEEHVTPFFGEGSHSSFFVDLIIRGRAPAFSPGEWQVRVFYNGGGIVALPFRISQPPASKIELVSATLLPSATVGARYHYRFTARGGEEPYRWSISSAVPAGLSFSEDGTLEGTPSAQGGYQFTVVVRDQAGNKATRSIALGVARPPQTPVVFNTLTASTFTGSACMGGPKKTDFSTTDAALSLEFTVGAGGQDRWSNGAATVEWLDPSGDVAYRTVVRTNPGVCVRQSFPLGANTHATPGIWCVRVLWAHGEAFSVPFTVTSPQMTKDEGAVAPGRWALIIGNAAYDQLARIPSAVTDVNLVATALRRDGFDVTSELNLSAKGWRTAEREFIGKVKRGGIAVVYYAGYGLHQGGENWLVPVDFDPRDRRPLSARAYSVVRLRQLLEENDVNVKIFFLNAAWPASALDYGGQKAGLSVPEVDRQTVISLAGPPKAAAETSNGASAFARALVQAINQPHAGLQDLDHDLRSSISAVESQAVVPTTVMRSPPEFKWRPQNGRPQ